LYQLGCGSDPVIVAGRTVLAVAVSVESSGIIRRGMWDAASPAMEPAELMLTAARAAAVYVLMLIVIRALGKRTVGNFSAFDLIVALMLGEVVDEIIYGDVRFIEGTVAVVAIGALAYADAWLAYFDHGMEAVLEGKPSIVVRDGEFDRKGMRSERMNEKDVLGHLREQGIHDMREVHLAVVEHDGTVSVLKQTWAEPAQKADVVKEAHRERQEMIGDDETPPPDKRTDSPKALDGQRVTHQQKAA
jgi:uncharacterized membrane protein YcaP (DUF421 family)